MRWNQGVRTRKRQTAVDRFRETTGRKGKWVCVHVQQLAVGMPTLVERDISLSPFGSQRRPPRQPGARGCLGKRADGYGKQYLPSRRGGTCQGSGRVKRQECVDASLAAETRRLKRAKSGRFGVQKMGLCGVEIKQRAAQ